MTSWIFESRTIDLDREWEGGIVEWVLEWREPGFKSWVCHYWLCGVGHVTQSFYPSVSLSEKWGRS